MKEKDNKGFEVVDSAGRSYAGRFASPYAEPMGKSLGVRFPLSLDKWLIEESERRGCTKTDLVREAVHLMSQNQHQKD